MNSIKRYAPYFSNFINYLENTGTVSSKKEENIKKFKQKFDLDSTFVDSFFDKKQFDKFKKIDRQFLPNKKQVEYLTKIESKNNKHQFEIETNKLRRQSFLIDEDSTEEEIDDILFKYSSLAFIHFVDKIADQSDTVTLTEDVFFILNSILKFFPHLEDRVIGIKELYYPLYYRNFMKDFVFDKNVEDITSLVMDFSRYDIDRLFKSDEFIYSKQFIETFLIDLELNYDLQKSSNLTIDGENDLFGFKEGDAEGFYLQLVLMFKYGKYRDNYDYLYKKIIGDDYSNLLVRKAKFAQFYKNRSQLKLLIKHIDESKLTKENKKVYDEIIFGLSAEGKKTIETEEMAIKVEYLLLFDKSNQLQAILDNGLDDFTIQNILFDILADPRFDSSDIDFILRFCPESIYCYLITDPNCIQLGDIENLLKMFVYLLNLDMLEDAWQIIYAISNKLKAKSLKEDSDFIEDLEFVLELIQIELKSVF